jgi:hypothetical protein
MAGLPSKSAAMSEEDMSAGRSEDPGDEEGDSLGNVQTLTDLFDQLDRAAFKRVLEYRDSFTAPPGKTAKQR